MIHATIEGTTAHHHVSCDACGAAAPTVMDPVQVDAGPVDVDAHERALGQAAGAGFVRQVLGHGRARDLCAACASATDASADEVSRG